MIVQSGMELDVENRPESKSRREGIRLVTLADSGRIQRDYVRRCATSWARIGGTTGRALVVDGGMTAADRGLATEMGMDVVGEAGGVDEQLRNRPALRQIRQRFLTWKKVVDPLLLCRNDPWILIIDTDVFIARPIEFAAEGPRFVYQCDDVPAYRGKWTLPFHHSMVYSLNAGFMLLPPAEIDLDLLEQLAANYFLHCKKMWWTAQSVWSVLMASSGDAGIFDGRDVRTFSGNRKRSIDELERNRVKLFGASALIETREEAMPLLRGAAVLHFAGKGKNWINLAEELCEPHAAPSALRVARMRPANIAQRALLAARMLAVHVKDRLNERPVGEA